MTHSDRSISILTLLSAHKAMHFLPQTLTRRSNNATPDTTEKMGTLAPKIKLDGADEEKQKRFETLPFLLKGHLLELAAAARSGDAAEQLEEMEEVAEVRGTLGTNLLGVLLGVGSVAYGAASGHATFTRFLPSCNTPSTDGGRVPGHRGQWDQDPGQVLPGAGGRL